MGFSSLTATSAGPTLGPTIAGLTEAYRTGATTPDVVCARILSAIGDRGEDGVWISLATLPDVLARCAELAATPGSASLPLYGVPFGVKDSIDVQGWPITLACPEYAYLATDTAPVVGALLDAGAIMI